MTRLVRGADGRMWTVHSRIEWRNPVESDDFEHDVSGGALPGIMMAGMLVVMVVVLIAWTPEQVVVPAWLILALAFLFAFFPVRWALRRPHTLVAESKATADELPPERWIGQVRGRWRCARRRRGSPGRSRCTRCRTSKARCNPSTDATLDRCPSYPR